MKPLFVCVAPRGPDEGFPLWKPRRLPCRRPRSLGPRLPLRSRLSPISRFENRVLCECPGSVAIDPPRRVEPVLPGGEQEDHIPVRIAQNRLPPPIRLVCRVHVEDEALLLQLCD